MLRVTTKRLDVRRLTITMLVTAVARVVFGQGGPPMITDDPGAPGKGKWGNSFGFAFEHRPNEPSIDVPEIDLNYGVGHHIQVTSQTAPVLLKLNDHGLIGGLGGTVRASWGDPCLGLTFGC